MWIFFTHVDTLIFAGPGKKYPPSPIFWQLIFSGKQKKGDESLLGVFIQYVKTPKMKLARALL